MIMLYPKNNQELILKNSSPTFRMSKWENPKTKKWKMMKIDIVLKFDVKVVAHSEAVQNTSTTSKLSILDHITSLKSELPPNNSYWKTTFFQFRLILLDTISYFRKVPMKNSYLKVIPMNYLDHVNHVKYLNDFCHFKKVIRNHYNFIFFDFLFFLMNLQPRPKVKTQNRMKIWMSSSKYEFLLYSSEFFPSM